MARLFNDITTHIWLLKSILEHVPMYIVSNEPEQLTSSNYNVFFINTHKVAQTENINESQILPKSQDTKLSIHILNLENLELSVSFVNVSKIHNKH